MMPRLQLESDKRRYEAQEGAAKKRRDKSVTPPKDESKNNREKWAMCWVTDINRQKLGACF